MTLAEFLLARIAEDERHARKLAEVDRRPVLSLAITVNHPERILAECEAKRAIVEWAAPVSGSERMPTDRPGVYDKRPTRYVSDDGEDLLRILAAPFRDHPDYDPAWGVS